MPHATGPSNGKHIPIRCLRQEGSEYFNYMGFHPLVLLALVDAHNKFIWYDIAASGSSSDDQIFQYSDLRQKIADNTIGFSSTVTCTYMNRSTIFGPAVEKGCRKRYQDFDQQVFGCCSP